MTVAGAVFLFAWSGIYNVAASSGHWAVVDWFLAFGMRNSVALRARAIAVPPLDDIERVRLGAGHFHSGCAFCHGTPDTGVGPIARQMLPSPPELSKSVRTWSDAQLFWIVQNGIKYTGMPGWAALERTDEIWAVVAFLKKLPTLDGESYRALALGRVRLAEQSGERMATNDSNLQAAGACARCHGAGSSGPTSALVPVLHGQSRAYMVAALRAYAQGTRRSGIMQPLAADLDKESIERLATYYAGLSPTEPAHGSPSGADAHGRILATKGDPKRDIPACDTCHGRDRLPRYPRLAGQSAAFLAGQLRLWAAGHHTSTPGAALMAPIARRMSEADIDAVAAYFSGLSRLPAGGAP